MCGIVGYVGEQQALEVVLDGLRRLEYRGYDSAGVAVLSPDGAGLQVEGEVTQVRRQGPERLVGVGDRAALPGPCHRELPGECPPEAAGPRSSVPGRPFTPGRGSFPDRVIAHLEDGGAGGPRPRWSTPGTSPDSQFVRLR